MTDKMEAFAQEYTVDRNGSAAAIRAGYAPNNAKEQAYSLLRHSEVKARIDELFSEIYERNKMGIDEAISILTDIARTEPADIFHEDGTMKDIHDIPKFARQAIEGVEFKTKYVWDELLEEHVAVSFPDKLKMTGKQAAIDKMLKHLGGYKVDNEQKKAEVTVLNINPLEDYDDTTEE